MASRVVDARRQLDATLARIREGDVAVVHALLTLCDLHASYDDHPELAARLAALKAKAERLGVTATYDGDPRVAAKLAALREKAAEPAVTAAPAPPSGSLDKRMRRLQSANARRIRLAQLARRNAIHELARAKGIPVFPRRRPQRRRISSSRRPQGRQHCRSPGRPGRQDDPEPLARRRSGRRGVPGGRR